jgi:hypothetical protein
VALSVIGNDFSQFFSIKYALASIVITQPLARLDNRSL